MESNAPQLLSPSSSCISCGMMVPNWLLIQIDHIREKTENKHNYIKSILDVQGRELHKT